MKRIKVIGCGGVGGVLTPILARFLRYRYPETELWFIDGDTYEPRNAERQVFDELVNKAEETARRVRQKFPEIVVRAVPEYITEASAAGLIREGDVVVAGVDNHRSRKILSDRVGELDNALLISGGNELTRGGLQVYWRKGGVDKTLPLTNEHHPEIANPTDQMPGPHCLERAVVEPQLILMNAAVAIGMLNALYAWLEGELDYDEVYIDIISGNVRAVNRRLDAVQTA